VRIRDLPRYLSFADAQSEADGYNDVFGISGRPPDGQQTDGGTGAETSDVSNAGCDARELASRGHYFPLQPLTICGITVFRDKCENGPYGD